MNELQDALAKWDKHHRPNDPFMRTFVDAARRVANLDLKASGRTLWSLTYPKGKSWDELQPSTQAEYEKQASAVLNAALGITTEDDNR